MYLCRNIVLKVVSLSSYGRQNFSTAYTGNLQYSIHIYETAFSLPKSNFVQLYTAEFLIYCAQFEVKTIFVDITSPLYRSASRASSFVI